jgi:hypothetical protein
MHRTSNGAASRRDADLLGQARSRGAEAGTEARQGAGLVVARWTRETCPQCHVEFQGFGLDAAHALIEHQRACPDPVLLEAMREVDAMLPNTPPIAPSVTWPALAAEYGSSAQRWMKFAEQLENENRSHQRRG